LGHLVKFAAAIPRADYPRRPVRLLLIHTGGTLMMRGADASPLAPDVYTNDLLAELPILRKIADIETRILWNLDSSDMQPHHWVELARAVHEALPRYDGFVIVHGTDTMAYTASALAFLLPGLDRTVVLTGSQTPLASVRTDARANLVDACHLATLRIPEVGIAFDSRFLRGCRASKLDAWGMSAFGSPCCPPLAELGLSVHVASHVLAPRPPVPFDARLEPRVLAVRTFPGLEPRLVHGALNAGMHGLLIEAFGAGNVPHLENSLIPVIEDACARDVPVVIVSQAARGAVELGRYEGGAAAARAGAIGGGDMTPEAALAKLMITIGRAEGAGTRTSAARDAFAVAPVGEMSAPPA
jgi:L-asparaginase